MCLGQVGAVAAREVSRFARNSREWQRLIEVCRVVDTVLVDQETVYAPAGRRHDTLRYSCQRGVELFDAQGVSFVAVTICLRRVASDCNRPHPLVLHVLRSLVHVVNPLWQVGNPPACTVPAQGNVVFSS